MRRGRTEILSPRLFSNAARALQAGYRQNSVEGDPWQLGGVFVVRPGGELLYAYRSREAGDHPEPADLLAALDHPAPIVEESIPEPSGLQRGAGLVLGALVDPTIVLSFDRTGFLLRSLAFSPADLDVDLPDLGGLAAVGADALLAQQLVRDLLLEPAVGLLGVTDLLLGLAELERTCGVPVPTSTGPRCQSALPKHPSAHAQGMCLGSWVCTGSASARHATRSTGARSARR